MDERALRAGIRDLEAGAIPDAAFVERLHGRLLAEAGYRATSPETAERPDASTGTGRMRRPWLRLLLIAAALLLVAGAAVAVASTVDRLRARPDLLATIQQSGRIDVVVPDGPPQAALPRGGWTGLDVDAAALIARRLGLETSFGVAPDGVPAPGSSWDMAVLAGPPADGGPSLLVTRPFAWWPVRLVVQDGDPSGGPAGLAGRGVCAVAGSDAERWLRGKPLRDGIPVQDPPHVTIVTGSDEAACRAALADGSAAAMVSGMSAADLQGDATLAPSGGPVLVMPRRLAVPADAGGRFRDALDLVIEGALADGGLSDVSRRRLGGEDITVDPAESDRP